MTCTNIVTEHPTTGKRTDTVPAELLVPVLDQMRDPQLCRLLDCDPKFVARWNAANDDIDWRAQRLPQDKRGEFRERHKKKLGPLVMRNPELIAQWAGVLTPRLRRVLGKGREQLWRHLVHLRGYAARHFPLSYTRLSLDVKMPVRTVKDHMKWLAKAHLIDKRSFREMRSGGFKSSVTVFVYGGITTYRSQEELWVPNATLDFCRTLSPQGGARNGAGRPNVSDEIREVYQAARAEPEELAELYGRTPANISRAVRPTRINPALKPSDPGSNPTRECGVTIQVCTPNTSESSKRRVLSSPSEKKDAPPLPVDAAPFLADQKNVRDHTVAKLQACRTQEASLLESIRTGKLEPSSNLTLWRVAGREFGWRAYYRLRSDELAAGYADPLTRWSEVGPPQNAAQGIL